MLKGTSIPVTYKPFEIKQSTIKKRQAKISWLASFYCYYKKTYRERDE
jgi:hypothetical protein